MRLSITSVLNAMQGPWASFQSSLGDGLTARQAQAERAVGEPLQRGVDLSQAPDGILHQR